MGSTSSPGRARQRNWFELIVEGVPDALLMADRDRRIAMVNRNTEALFGYSRAELLGQSIEMLVPERLRDRHIHHVMNFLADPMARPMGGNRELLGRRRDGSEVSIEIGLNPIETPGGLFTLASIIDITERRHAEDVRQQMAALVESADDAILSKTLDGVIRSWNPGAERLLGYRAEEIVGQPVTRLIPDDRQGESAMILELIGNGQRVENFETIRRRKDGTAVHVSLTISPIRDRAGSIVGASKIMRDITAHKRIQDELRRSNAELEQKNAELDDFVYTASHDLRAPLTGVSTVAQWILDDDRSLTDETRKRLLLIHKRIERMMRLLNDIRDYARTGRFAESPGTALSAAMLVADIADTSHVPAGFSIECDSSLQAVQVYRVPIEQVLRNLINNAIKHHDRRTGVVTVSAGSHDAWHRFSVIDDGPGVPEKYRDTIFEMFATLKPRDEVEGSGIGLALVRKIVGRMGGTCGCEPMGERGMNFWFEWPSFGLPVRGAG
jgi:PAS domain S-box-containing protein